MNCSDISYRRATATRAEILAHLTKCDAQFSPPLHTYADLEEYSTKIAERAMTFEAWSGGVLVGFVAAYLNDPAGRAGFVTNASVFRECARRGIAARLMADALECAREMGFETVACDVAPDNVASIGMCEKVGYVQTGQGDGGMIRMVARLRSPAAG